MSQPSSNSSSLDSRRSVPTALYPPMSHRNPSTQLKSSLSSKPQYSTTSLPGGGTTDGSMADLSESDSKSRSSLKCAARFCDPLLVAVINSSKPSTQANSLPVPSSLGRSTTTRKLGPVLLEIQQMEWNPTGNSLYTLKTVARSRGNPSLGISVASTCLDVLEASNDKDAFPSSAVDGSGAISMQPCVTGLSTGALCVHSFPSDFDWGGNSDQTTTTTEYYHTGRHHRPATAVAWRPSVSHQVAISWAGHSSGTSASGPGGVSSHPSKRGVTVGSHGRSQPHDRDFGCFVWDLQSHNTKVPLRRLGHQVGATDVGWIMQGNLLVWATRGAGACVVAT